MAARGTLIDANSRVASLRKPFDTRDFHHITATARRPFSRAGHQQTLKYRHWPIQCEMPAARHASCGVLAVGRLTCSPSFSCFGYFNEISGVDVIDVAVNRNMLSDEGMFTDTAYVLSHA